MNRLTKLKIAKEIREEFYEIWDRMIFSEWIKSEIEKEVKEEWCYWDVTHMIWRSYWAMRLWKDAEEPQWVPCACCKKCLQVENVVPLWQRS